MGATGPDLLGVENDAAEAMGERAVESDVGAEHDVDPVARQPVARQRAIDAEAAQVVSAGNAPGRETAASRRSPPAA